jgi:hypothetical protein
MGKYSEAFVAFDIAKKKNAAAIERAVANLNRRGIPESVLLGGGQQGWLKPIRRICGIV